MTNFQDYILNTIDAEGYDRDLKNNESKVKFVFDCFSSEYIHANNVKQFHRDNAKVFGEWLSGLPSSINIDFYNHKILDIGYLFDFISAGATEEEQDEFLNGWFELIAKVFFNMHKKLHRYA